VLTSGFFFSLIGVCLFVVIKFYVASRLPAARPGIEVKPPELKAALPTLRDHY